MGILMKHLFNKLFYPNKEDPRVPHQCFEYDFKNISLYDVQYHIGKGHITYAGETMYPIIGYTILSKEVNRSDWPIYKDLFTEEILDNYLVNEAKYQGDKQKHGWKSTEPETFVTKSELGELGKELNEVLVHESNSEKIDEILNILRRIEQRQILSESNLASIRSNQPPMPKPPPPAPPVQTAATEQDIQPPMPKPPPPAPPQHRRGHRRNPQRPNAVPQKKRNMNGYESW
jgi:hypothetical protein